ncbi:MAG TPA: LLM class flavin-dependent oxidoreductase [Sporosarcina sp.]|nr:LLM class flavin-dependent oxidoreductase [Sporosarcina sp.]
MIKLSILDQSPIAEGQSPREALRETVQLAQYAERLGFTRFWVSEHHDATTLAGSSPEVLMSHLATKTSSIRIGSGGVMLTHYAPYKVAENFKVLEALFPGRIDLGVGRAPGGMPRATYALNNGKYRDATIYPEQLDELSMYLHDRIPDDHPYYGMKATPSIQEAPPIWTLGSSTHSAKLAAEKGLPYMYAKFINDEGGEEAASVYEENFQPSPYCKTPTQAVAVFFVCAETEEDVETITSSLDLSLLLSAQGIESSGTPSPETAKTYVYSPFEAKYIPENRKRMIIGTPASAKKQIEALAEAHRTDEVMLVMNTFRVEDKMKAYELIAKEMFGDK